MKYRNLLNLVILLCSIPLANADIYKEWSSPVNNKESQKVLIYGSIATGLLVASRDSTIEKFQDYAQQHGLMSEDMASFGDIMGQTVPNILYIAGNYYVDNKKSEARMKLMAKATMYAGVTTMILKRIVNQRRPNSKNRHSFPSGHTTTAFAFASVVAKEHEWYWGASAYSLATLVALSRIHDNAHYIHDVVFGAAIGTAFGLSLSSLNDDASENISLVPTAGGAYFNYKYSFN